MSKTTAAMLVLLAGISCSSANSARRDGSTSCAPLDTVVLQDVTLVPMDTERVLEHHSMVVCKNVIVAMGPVSRVTVPPGARVIAGQGRFVLPGLADMHTHLVREQDLALYIARGVTTVRNMWGAPMHLQWRQRIAQGTLLGPSIVTAGPIVDGENPPHDGSLVVTNQAGAEAAIQLHKTLGYDFVKVYSRLSPEAYTAVVTQAKAARFTVSGHVPRGVGLEQALRTGQNGIEHLEGFLDALQPDDSPVKNMFGKEEYWRKKLELADLGKAPALLALMKGHGAFSCPTRVVKDGFGPPDVAQRMLARPEAQYVPASERVIWGFSRPMPPDEIAAVQHEWKLNDQLIVATRNAGVRQVVGTDPGNKLVVPGFAVQDELNHWVRAGLTPYEALVGATREAAGVVGAQKQWGTLAPGLRADLLMVDGNPLQEIANTSRISGVMVQGHWLDTAALQDLLKGVLAANDPARSPFTGMPPLAGEGAQEFAATYLVTWKDTPFGAERVRVGKLPNGQLTITAQSHDPHSGQTTTLNLQGGADGVGQHMTYASDGAEGRGSVDVARNGTALVLAGTGLPGVPVQVNGTVESNAVLGGDKMLAGKVLLAPQLMRLAEGAAHDIKVAEVGLGSTAWVKNAVWKVTRTADVNGGRAFAIQGPRGPAGTLTMDGQGWPVRWEVNAYGAVVRFQRVGPG